ncbi:MAG: ATP-binding protein [Candidatus Woesearchaeota archaeon]
MKSIIMLHGLPGTGKSFIAQKIASYFDNSVVLKTVHFRENLADSSAARFDETRPETREEKDRTYRQLVESARQALAAGKVPVLDATFHKKYRREWVYGLAKETGANLAVISVDCNADVVFERLKRREAQMNEDAFLKSREAFEIMKRQAEPLGEEVVNIMRINTAHYVDFKELVAWLKNILL